MALVEKRQCALKELIDLFFGDFVRREEPVKIELRKTSVGYASRKKFAQAARFDGTECADFFKHHALQRILKNGGIEQFADFQPGSAFDQHRAEEPQRVPLQLRPVLGFVAIHAKIPVARFSLIERKKNHGK